MAFQSAGKNGSLPIQRLRIGTLPGLKVCLKCVHYMYMLNTAIHYIHIHVIQVGQLSETDPFMHLMAVTSTFRSVNLENIEWINDYRYITQPVFKRCKSKQAIGKRICTLKKF